MNRKTLLGDPPPITMTGHDFGRLSALIANFGARREIPFNKSYARVLEFLSAEVDRARIVHEPADEAPPFVKMGSRVTFRDETGRIHHGVLVFPSQESPNLAGISILTPAGAALLGLSEGQAISYETPDARIKTITLLTVSPTP